MNAVDIALVVVALGFAVYGLVRGLVFELLMLLGFIAAYVVAVMHMSALATWMNKLLGLPFWIPLALGFLVLFVLTLLICKWIAGALRHLFTRTPAAFWDRLGGGVFGLAKGVLIASLLAIAVSFTGLPSKLEAEKAQSKLFNPARRVAPAVFNFITRSFPKTKSFADEVREAVPGFAKPDSVNTLLKRIEKFQRELTSGRDEIESLEKEVREHADKP
jgi:membrane protein required for colicin V production